MGNFFKKSLQPLSVRNREYRDFILEFFGFLLRNDLDKNGDITSELLINKFVSGGQIVDDERFIDGEQSKSLSLSKVSVNIIVKEDGILAGREEIEWVLENLDSLDFLEKGFGDRVKFSFKFKDGEEFKKGDVLVELEGDLKLILLLERTILNFLMRMSGIATYTRKLVKEIKTVNNSGGEFSQNENDISKVFNDSKLPKLAATRKTLWGGLDKKAVSVGGGWSHRLNLSDAVMIKDNHLDAFWDLEKSKSGKNQNWKGERFKDFNFFKKVLDSLDLGLGKLVETSGAKSEMVPTKSPTPRFIEFEVETSDEAFNLLKALESLTKKENSSKENDLNFSETSKILDYPIIIMLDNFSPKEIRETLEVLKSSVEFKKIQKINAQFFFEASGGINEKNLAEYATTGVDIISTSCLTMQANYLDLSLKVKTI